MGSPAGIHVIDTIAKDHYKFRAQGSLQRLLRNAPDRLGKALQRPCPRQHPSLTLNSYRLWRRCEVSPSAAWSLDVGELRRASAGVDRPCTGEQSFDGHCARDVRLTLSFRLSATVCGLLGLNSIKLTNHSGGSRRTAPGRVAWRPPGPRRPLGDAPGVADATRFPFSERTPAARRNSGIGMWGDCNPRPCQAPVVDKAASDLPLYLCTLSTS
jgi:hypothetical protein